MIPKIIHYCWFGGNKKSKLIRKCMQSWQRFCPEYEIIEWNEENFDINCCEYVSQAYESKKWAFVSDYARFYALNKYGGIYLDTDVELIKPIDGFLANEFTAFEKPNSVATGLIFACDKDNKLCAEMLRQYENDKFITDNGLNTKTVCTRVTEYLQSHGLVLDGATQCIDGLTVYDISYFNPYDLDSGKINIKDNTVSIHHYAATWVKPIDKFRGAVFRALYRFLGENTANKIRKAIGRKK